MSATPAFAHWAVPSCWPPTQVPKPLPVLKRVTKGKPPITERSVM